jgi:hypothetical protein
MGNPAMETRDDIESRIAELRRDRGAATLAGKRFDTTVIGELEDRLQALDDAEAERTRIERERAAKDRAAARARKLENITKLEEDRLLAWADLEAACRAQLQAIGRVLSATESQRVLWSDLTAAVPMVLGPFETKSRIRGRTGELLSVARAGFEVAGAGGIYVSAAIEDWRELERKSMAPHIEALSMEKN